MDARRSADDPAVRPAGGERCLHLFTPYAGAARRYTRLGRVELETADDLQDGHTFRLFYQDVRARWHATEFLAGAQFRTRFRGRQFLRRVPRSVREHEQFSTALDVWNGEIL